MLNMQYMENQTSTNSVLARKFQVLEGDSLCEQMAAVIAPEKSLSSKRLSYFLLASSPGNGNLSSLFIFKNGFASEISAMRNWQKTAGILISKAIEMQKITFNQATQKRLEFLPSGSLAEQMAYAMGENKNRHADLNHGENKTDHKELAQNTLNPAKALPSPDQPENAAAEKEEIPDWRYEVAMGRESIRERFFNLEYGVPENACSIPAYFPTHQWIFQILTEQQWLQNMEEGEWKNKRIATKPIPL